MLRIQALVTYCAERTISMVRETSLEGRIEVKLAAAPK
jgi:hypothetical protein